MATFLQTARDAKKRGVPLVWEDEEVSPKPHVKKGRFCHRCKGIVAVRGMCLKCKLRRKEKLRGTQTTLDKTRKGQAAKRKHHANLVKKRGYGEKITIEKFKV